VHVPAVPASAHDRQLPVQALMQQVPCSQKPLAQSPGAEQVAPLGFLAHEVPLHTLGATQSFDVAHVVRQLPLTPQT